ncbi:MAG: CHAP domain-containing protein [Candidatus Acidiferrales bacterium]
MPFVNGRFYANPAHGHALERARIAEDGFSAPDRSDLGQEQGGHWVTIDSRRVLVDRGQAGRVSRARRDKIAVTARKYNGSTDWGFAKRKDNFASGTNKCNKFVYDVTKEAGATATVTGSDGKSRAPLAGEWADPNTHIPGWRVLGPNETPQPGDVAAYKLPGGGTSFSGHSGIVTDVEANGRVHAVAAHSDVVGPDDKFNSTRDRAVTYRRFEGGR